MEKLDAYCALIEFLDKDREGEKQCDADDPFLADLITSFIRDFPAMIVLHKGLRESYRRWESSIFLKALIPASEKASSYVRSLFNQNPPPQRLEVIREEAPEPLDPYLELKKTEAAGLLAHENGTGPTEHHIRRLYSTIALFRVSFQELAKKHPSLNGEFSTWHTRINPGQDLSFTPENIDAYLKWHIPGYNSMGEPPCSEQISSMLKFAKTQIAQ
jgi:hypothetical protein